MPCGWYVDDSRAQALEHWERIEALGAQRVFAVDAASTFSRPGPRLVDGVELLGHLLHPDLVDPPGNIGFAELRSPQARPRRLRLTLRRSRARRATAATPIAAIADQLERQAACGPSMPRSPATISRAQSNAGSEPTEVAAEADVAERRR